MKNNYSKLNSDQYEILHILDEGVVDTLTLLNDFAKIRNTTIDLVTTDVFHALQSLLQDKYIAINKNNRDPLTNSGNILLSLLNHDPESQTWYWLVAVQKNDVISTFALYGGVLDKASFANFKRSCIGLGLNTFAFSEHNINWIEDNCMGFPPTTFEICDKGVQKLYEIS